MSLPISTRKPTGRPSWPIALLAGVEKSGKSFKAAEASGSPLVHRTFWVGVGEDDPDEYAMVPGSRFEIVEHDGTYRGILNAVVAAADQEPGPNGEPNLIVFDSSTRLWALLSDNAQQTANERWAKKNDGKPIPEDGVRIAHDLWNVANSRWQHVIDALRAHQGPSIITSRLKEVTVFENGEPTKERKWKEDTQNTAPYDVGLIVQMRASYPEHDTYLTGVRSMRYKHETDRKGRAKLTPLPEDWSFDGLWRNLGLADEPAGERVHAHTVTESGDQEAARIAAARQDLLTQIKDAAPLANVSLDKVAQVWANDHDGQNIGDATDLAGLEVLLGTLEARAEQIAQGDAQPSAQDAAQNAAQTVAQSARAAVAPARAEEPPAPAQDARPAPAAIKETPKEKTLRIAGDELALQADALGVEYVEHAKPVTGANGDLMVTKAPKYVIEQRPRTIAAMREAGRDVEAAAYERAGQGFPIELHIIFDDDTEDRAAGATPREDARR